MKTELISKLAITLLLSATTLATDWDIDWLRYPHECVLSWDAYASGPMLTFTGPTGFYSNSCFAQQDLGGRATVRLDPESKVVELWFKPPPPDTCIAVYLPVCGLRGTVGPLAEGPWLFITGTTSIPVHIYGLPAEPNLAVLTPGPGEFVLADSKYTIAWTDSPGEGNCAGSYLLCYSTDNGENWLPVDANTVEGRCSYEWHVPPTTSDQCLLRIQDTANQDVNDVTDGAFCIYECQEAVPGDLNEDCYVDFRDYSLLFESGAGRLSWEALAAFADQWCDCGNPYDPACGY
jgi:hypothetical protein